MQSSQKLQDLLKGCWTLLHAFHVESFRFHISFSFLLTENNVL